MIQKLSKYNRFIGYEARRLFQSLTEYEKEVYSKVDTFFNQYCQYYDLNVDEISKMIDKFIMRYKFDLDNFIKLGKFPYELSGSSFTLSRIEYDLFLISSVLFTPHRFQIINLISKLHYSGKQISCIGIGSGLELAFLSNSNNHIIGYDIEISEFVKYYFNDIHFEEKLFIGNESDNDVVIAVELLEHLSKPFLLIQDIYNSLKNNGEFITTTIKNVPQFDHLFNFTDESLFLEQLNKIGFQVNERYVIEHFYRFTNVEANNIFYKLKKYICNKQRIIN